MNTPRRSTLSLLALLAVTSACATGEVEPRDAAVDTGAARDAPVANDTSPTELDAPPAEDVTTDAGSEAGPPVDSGRCVANNDGVLERGELAFVIGATVLYASNDEDVVVDPVDVNGATVEGQRVWNYAAARDTDRRVLDEVLSPQGRWWSAFYPDATFATVIERSTQTLGVYRVSATALELLATVSSDAGRTNLRFTPPVLVLRFPLRVGDAWEQSVNGAGTLNFTGFANVTRYANRVDTRGEVWTPAGRFPALRLNTELDQSVPLTIFRVTRRTYTFVSECLGVVARVASVDDDTSASFTRASEYRRLGL